MKLKRKYKFIGIIVIILLIILFTKKESSGNTHNIDNYLSNNKDIIVDKIDFGNTLEVVTKIDNKYQIVLFNKDTDEEIEIDNIITNQEEYNKKITELLYLKYPDFIVEKLKNSNKQVYYLKGNELVIYYYDVDNLTLKVNYNEVKDYINLDVHLDKSYENEDGSKIDLSKKIIALTFDDGPSKYTKEFVDTFKSYKYKCTFFMLGSKVNSFKDTVKYINDNGFEIGYHSYAHTNFKKQTLAKIKEELEISNNNLNNIIGKSFYYTRPPYGSINQEIKSVINMPLIFWNVDTEDWRHKDPDYLVNYVLENVHDGDIVLFHDIHATTLEAIKKLLPKLYLEGYQVVTISDLASIGNHELKNNEIYRYFTR